MLNIIYTLITWHRKNNSLVLQLGRILDVAMRFDDFRYTMQSRTGWNGWKNN